MFYAVIPAGGSGTRLWPLSRAGNPKFLHALTGTPASLLQATVRRVAPLAGPERTFVVTGTAHAATVARQLPDLPERNILVEPSPRDSCAAIGLAAAVIARRDPDALMGSFAADHLVSDIAKFQQVIEAAIAGAEAGWLMTVGMTPTRPETGFGYVDCGDVVGPGPVRLVREFKEKPRAEVAEQFVAAGNYLWNASMFVWRVEVFLEALRQREPELHDGLQEIAASWGTSRQNAVVGEVWPSLKRIAVEYAVMEDAAAKGRVATVPGDFGWSDIGDFRNLGELLPSDSRGNVVIRSNEEEKDACVLLRDVDQSVVVSATGRTVCAIGVKDVVIVDTADALLVCARERVQDVKGAVQSLIDSGRGDVV